MSSTRYEQPELPLAEASLAEHKRLTGHDPIQDGTNQWFCPTYMPEKGKHCQAEWPPPTPRQMSMAYHTAEILSTGKTEIEVPGVGTIELGYN